ncbi:MAG: hypothetical protein IJU81_08585 [Bacteroidales bacterium]|nr:hypothetical protein [Bacteroidales bacterium]
MRKAFILAAAAATMLMASCSKEESKEVQTFKASAEQTSETSKISLSGLSLRWSAGDQISVYDAASNNGVYALSSGEGTANGEFAHSSGSSVSAAPFSAVYPASIRTGATTVSLPATQSSTDGGLQELPMYAVGDDMELKFHHLCGVVRFRLSASSAVSVSRIAVATDRNTNGAATISGSGSSVTLSTLGGSATTTLSLGTAQDIASARDFYMYLPAGTYSTFVVAMTAEGGASCTKTVNRAIVVERGNITTITLTDLAFSGGLTQGALSGEFSVALGRTVHFSQGNLQYQASTGTWRFATNQYDYIGNANSNISSTYSGWIDLFGWGTSGWNSGANCYQPWSTSTSYTDYYPGGSSTNNLTGSYANADWGVYNAISNGGNAAGLWRTPTREEWDYLFNTRSASTVNGTSNARFAKGTVNSEAGVILFPDSYTHPDGVAQPTNINSSGVNYTGNNYSASDWTAMQTAGVVFLPAAGYRSGTTVNDVGSCGYYWSSSYYNSDIAWRVIFISGRLCIESNSSRYDGWSVRLVRD